MCISTGKSSSTGNSRIGSQIGAHEKKVENFIVKSSSVGGKNSSDKITTLVGNENKPTGIVNEKSQSWFRHGALFLIITRP